MRIKLPRGVPLSSLAIDASARFEGSQLATEDRNTLRQCAIAIGHDFPRLLRGEPRWQARAERLAARTVDLLTFVKLVEIL